MCATSLRSAIVVLISDSHSNYAVISPFLLVLLFLPPPFLFSLLLLALLFLLLLPFLTVTIPIYNHGLCPVSTFLSLYNLHSL